MAIAIVCFIIKRRMRITKMAELTITNQNFNTEVMQSNKPVLLDFWAEWCGPCRMLAPIVGEIAEMYDGVIKVGKVNVDEQRELADRFEISSIPTLVLIKNGATVAQSVGYRSKAAVAEMIDKAI